MKKILLLFCMLISACYLYAQTTENPIVEEAKQKHAHISVVMLSPDRTIIAVDVSEWLSGWGHWASLSSNTYIEYMNPEIKNIETKQILRLANINGTTLGFKTKYYNLPSGVFVLEFPGIPKNVSKINLIEKGGYKWYRINITPRADVSVPNLASNEKELNSLIENTQDESAGIYEQLSTTDNNSYSYRLALVEKDSSSYLIYANNKEIGDWKYGDVKAILRKTTNNNLYKADWYLFGKIPSSAYIIKDGSNLKVHIDSNNSDITLVKMTGKHTNVQHDTLTQSKTSSKEYVIKKEGERWGPKEMEYEELGEKGISFINQDMYSLAVQCFEQILTINCKNADRIKDYYSLVYCYTMLDDPDKVIENGKKYIALSPKQSDKNIHQIYSFMGMAFADKKEWKTASFYWEAAILSDSPDDLVNLTNDYYMDGRCYWALNNHFLAKKNYKKAIDCGLKYYGITINQIATYGGNYDLLGEVFYYYASLEIDSYKNWNDLLYLAIKCGYKQALEKHSELLTIYKESGFHPNNDLFE